MLGRLFRKSGTYALVGVVAKGSGAVLTVFYVNTAYLPVEGYGYLGALRAVMAAGLLVASAGLPLALIRFGTSAAVSDAERAAVPVTALGLAAGLGALAAAVLWAGAPTVAGWLTEGGGAVEPVRWVAPYVWLQAVAGVSYAVLRQHEEAGRYVLASAVEAAALVAAVLYFLVVRGEGLVGVLKGHVVAAAVVAAVLTAGLLRRASWRPDWRLVRPMLAFGAPLVVSGLAGRFLYLGDRLVLVRLAGLEATGTYEFAAQFGSLVHTFLVQGFQLSFTVVGMKAFGGPETAALYRRSFRHFATVAAWAALGVGLFANSVAGLFATDPAYLDIDGTAALVAGGFGFNGLYAVTVSMLYAAERTRRVAVNVVASALLNLGLNLVLVPRLGIAGAALATLVAYAVLAVWTSPRGRPRGPGGVPVAVGRDGRGARGRALAGRPGRGRVAAGRPAGGLRRPPRRLRPAPPRHRRLRPGRPPGPGRRRPRVAPAARRGGRRGCKVLVVRQALVDGPVPALVDHP